MPLFFLACHALAYTETDERINNHIDTKLMLFLNKKQQDILF